MSENDDSILFNVSQDLDEDDLNGLKFLFKDHLHKPRLTEITEGYQLFKHLSEKKLISSTDVSLVRETLLTIGRNDLASKLRQSPPTGIISSFRYLLYDVASNLCPDDIDRGLYLFNIPKGKIKNAFDFLLLLEQRKRYSEQDTHQLQDWLKKLGRIDLADKLSKFRNLDQDGVRGHASRRRGVQETNGDNRPSLSTMGAAPILPAAECQRTDTVSLEKGDIDSDAAEPSSRSSTVAKMFEGALGKSLPDKEPLIENKLLLDAGQSVGRIGCNGTGFVVGSGCIMTPAHVFKEALRIPDDVINRCEGLYDYARCVQERLQCMDLRIEFTFLPQPQTFRLAKVLFMDTDIDTSVVEVDSNSNISQLPPPLTRFMDVPDFSFYFEFIGHDNADPHISRDRKCYTIVEKLDFQRMKKELERRNVHHSQLMFYDRFGKNPSFVQFHCSMKNGASGSPGVVVRNGEVLVFTMLRAGFPEHPHNAGIPEELCVEQGVSMRAIRERIRFENPRLCSEIFACWEQSNS